MAMCMSPCSEEGSTMNESWGLHSSVIYCIVLYSSVYNYTFCVQHCSEIHMQWHKIMNEYTQKNLCCVQLYICVHFAVVKFICSDTCKMMNEYTQKIYILRFICCTSWGAWLRAYEITLYKNSFTCSYLSSKLLTKIFYTNFYSYSISREDGKEYKRWCSHC